MRNQAVSQKLALVATLLSLASAGSISRPVAHDSELDRAVEWTRPKVLDADGAEIPGPPQAVAYHTRASPDEAEVRLKGDAAAPGGGNTGGKVWGSAASPKPHSLGQGNAQCPLELELLWAAQLGGAVYANPLARRSMFSDGGVQIVAPTFARYLELVEGAEGLAPEGWPLAFDVEDPEDSDDDDDEDDDHGDGSNQGASAAKHKHHNRPVGGGGAGASASGAGRKQERGPALFHGSAMVHDVNGDGVDDVGVCDDDGNVYWVAVGAYGEYLHDYRISVPKLRVKRDWHVGLDQAFTDNYVELSMFHHDASGGGSGSGGGGFPERVGEDQWGGGADDVAISANGGAQFRRAKEADTLAPHAPPRLHHAAEASQARSHSWGSGSGGGGGSSSGGGRRRSLMSVSDDGDDGKKASLAKQPARRKLLEEVSEGEAEGGGEVEEGAVDFGDGGVDDASGGEGMQFGDDLTGGRGAMDDLYGYGTPIDGGMDDLGYGSPGGSGFNASEYVLIDAHVLSTPTLADVDGDGHVELILAVSYFFDRNTAGAPAAAPSKDSASSDKDASSNSSSSGFDPRMYVAGGVVCYDFALQTWSWTTHLDLTTDYGKWKADVLAAPTVADLDGDGAFEVVLGTSLGLLYALDARTGFVLEGWPLQLGPIEAQVAAADVVTKDNKGDLEILVGDMRGNLLCVSRSGTVLWDRQLPGSIGATPTVGDVNGDGALDVVVSIATTSGASILYAVRGDNGADLPHFPIRVASSGQGPVYPPVLLLDLHEATSGLSEVEPSSGLDGGSSSLAPQLRGRSRGSSGSHYGNESNSSLAAQHQQHRKKRSGPAPLGGVASGLHLLFPTHDGGLHVVEGGSGCLNRVELGERVYAMPLADDLQGDGLLDLVIGTMSGELLAFGTSAPYHPLNSWQGMPNGQRNGFTYGRHFGVFLYGGGSSGGEGRSGSGLLSGEAAALGEVREVVGRTFPITFEIVDQRPMSTTTANSQDRGDSGSSSRWYDVTLSLGSNGVAPLWQGRFDSPGTHTVELSLPQPMLATVALLVVNDHGQASSATLTVSYNQHFYDSLKWVASLPLLLVALPLLVAQPGKKWGQRDDEVELPS